MNSEFRSGGSCITLRFSRGHAKLKPHIYWFIAILLMSIGANAQQPLEPESQSEKIESQAVNGEPRYRIGPYDVLDIRVFNRPQLSRESVRVDESGTITMPLIGEIRAACRTEKELAREITTQYLEYVKNPQVDVFVKDFQSQAIAVIGAVRTPGRFQLQRPVRLIEILSLVGGPNEKAGRSVQIIRMGQQPVACQTNDQSQVTVEESVVSFDLKETLIGSEKANPFLQPGDIVSLLEADQVFITGNVLRPAPILLSGPLTVSQAIAMAGGVMPDSKSDKIRIVRRVNGAKKELFADLNAIDKRQAEDIELQANDVIDVPTSGTKRFMRSLLGVIAPTVATLPVRVVY